MALAVVQPTERSKLIFVEMYLTRRLLAVVDRRTRALLAAKSLPQMLSLLMRMLSRLMIKPFLRLRTSAGHLLQVQSHSQELNASTPETLRRQQINSRREPLIISSLMQTFMSSSTSLLISIHA